MDFNSILNNSLGTLAFKPFCQNYDNLYNTQNVHTYTDQLTDGEGSLYFNWFNSNISEDVGKEIGNGAVAALDDLGIDNFTTKYCSLEDCVRVEKTDNVNVPEIQQTIPTAFLPGSPNSLSSSGSLDDLLDEITRPFGSPTSSPTSRILDNLVHDFTTSFASTISSSSLDNLDFLDNLIVFDEGQYNSQMVSATSPVRDVMFELDLPETVALPNGRERLVNVHSSTEMPDTNNIFCFVDVLSPNSDDSGISSSDETNVSDFTHVEKNCFPPGYDREFFEVDAYPTSQDNVDSIVIDQTVSHLSDSSFSAQLGNVKGRQRSAPYKAKEKTEEQKLRKKEHNRKSASKYRSKKKEQAGNVFDKLRVVEDKNKKLKTNVEDLRKEIDYLKSLMLDVINARLSKNMNISLDALLPA